jgi:Flp pilus assembly protein TadD
MLSLTLRTLSVLVVVSCLFCEVLPQAWGSSGRVKVIIQTQPEHAELKTAQVRLRSLRGNTLQAINLHGEKSCVFQNVARGNFILEVESPGFVSVEHSFASGAFSRTDEPMVMVTLRPLVQDVPGEGGTVSIGDLSIPDSARKEMLRAQSESENGRSDRAIRHFKRAIEIYPPFFQAYNNLAVEYLKIGRTEDAKEALLRAISLEPEAAFSHRNLAEIYLAEQQFEEALRSLGKAMALQPRDPLNLMLAGEIYLKLSRCDIAMPYLLAAANADSNSHSYLGLAQCYLQTGRVEQALKELSEFVRLFPNDPRADLILQGLSEGASEQNSN